MTAPAILIAKCDTSVSIHIEIVPTVLSCIHIRLAYMWKTWDDCETALNKPRIHWQRNQEGKQMIIQMILTDRGAATVLDTTVAAVPVVRLLPLPADIRPPHKQLQCASHRTGMARHRAWLML